MIHRSGKNSPKKQGFCQELIAVSGTFASPEKQGLIIDAAGFESRTDLYTNIENNLQRKPVGPITIGKKSLK